MYEQNDELTQTRKKMIGFSICLRTSSGYTVELHMHISSSHHQKKLQCMQTSVRSCDKRIAYILVLILLRDADA